VDCDKYYSSFVNRLSLSKMSLIAPLPVLRPGQQDHPEWRAYLRWVYGEDTPEDVDLNGFSWFYWNSPLGRVSAVPHVSSEALPAGTAWTCELPWLPEYRFRAYGFFVARPSSAEDMRLAVRRRRLEVLRVRFPEEGVAWFYSGIGSGVFLNLDALPSPGSVVVSSGLPPDWQGGVLDTTAASWMTQHHCSLLVLAERFADGRVEIVVRAPDGSGSEDATCPFSASAFSTGFERSPCVCRGDGVELLNCRPEVREFLKTRRPSTWASSLFAAGESWTVLGLGAFFAAVFVAVLLQHFGR